MSPGLTRIFLIGLGTAVVPLDITVNVAFPAITAHFGLPIASIQWVIICYMLTHGSLMLACGRLGDLYGHAFVFRLGLAWNSVAFLLCAVAPTFEWLLAARVMQGIGASLIASCGPALVTALAPESQRARMLAVYTLLFAVGAALGPLVGGLLVELGGWRAVFWFRAPLALAACLLFRAPDIAPRSPARERFDLVGSVLLAVTLAAFLLALNQLRAVADGGWQALPLAALAAAGLYAFILQQRRAKAPLIDLTLFRAAEFSLLNLGNIVAQLAAFVPLLLVPYFLDRVLAYPALTIGLILTAGPLGTMAASPVGGRLAGRVPPGRLLAIGAVLLAAGLGLIATWQASTPVPLLLLALALQGFGAGLFQIAYLDVVTARMPAAARGVAGSLTLLTRTIGVVTSASLFTLLFQLLNAGRPGLEGFGTAFLIAALLAAAVPLLTRVRR
ncbi:MFS transporter [Desertibaculum subflavum]|uniref:MFS transporter n=1 Tax=Desertibaculum subflavum TaxID=2268458 RepID=UPI000E66980D